MGECEPKYEIVHRGVMDLQEAWEGSADNRVKFQNTVPKALVVRFLSNQLTSIICRFLERNEFNRIS